MHLNLLYVQFLILFMYIVKQNLIIFIKLMLGAEMVSADIRFIR